MPSVRTRPPQRTCVACRESGEKRSLTRLVRTADGHVQHDATGRLPGRGAYLCNQPECWDRALGKGDALARALRTTVTSEDRATLLTHAPAPAATALGGGAGKDRE